MAVLRKMGRKVAWLLLCFSVMMWLVGCETKGQKETNLKNTLSSPMELYLSAERRGEVFGANVVLGEGDTMARDMEITFLTPPSVKGLNVSQVNGEVTARFGTLLVKEDAVRQILLLLSPFSLHSYSQSTAYREGDDHVFCYMGEGESVTFYVGKDPLPHKIIYTVTGETITLYPSLKQLGQKGELS